MATLDLDQVKAPYESDNSSGGESRRTAVFVQVIEAEVGDRARLRLQFDKWVKELASGATGWLGHTAGVADDGTFFAAVRFESADAARANSDRPEQGEWWEETRQWLDEDARFADCGAVDTVGKKGGSDDAGFVQVIRGRGDRQAMLAATKGMASFFARLRPDVLGTYVAWEGDDRFTQLVYFTSEAEARAGEQRREILMPAVECDRFINLSDLWFASAG